MNGKATRPPRSRVVGKPGRSTRNEYRAAADAYTRLPTKWVLIGAALICAVAATGANTIGAAPLPVLAWTAGALLTLDFTARKPSAAATCVVVGLSAIASTPFAYVYAGSASGGLVDRDAATATMAVLLALTGLLAHRTSRGRPWVTTLITATLLLLVTPWLLIVAPWMGFAWAWLTVIVVLILRAGGIAWAVDQWADLTETIYRFRTRRTLTPEAQTLGDKATAEETTGQLLASLPATYTVFHDRTLTKTGQVINHIVVGPNGWFVIESHHCHGRVYEDPQIGLAFNGASLAPQLNLTATAAWRLDQHLGLPGFHHTPAHPVVVLHEAVLPHNDMKVALSSDGNNLGQVSVLTPENLINLITTNPIYLSTRDVRRLVARIDRISRPTRADASNRPTLAFPVTAHVLDENGTPRTAVAPETPQPLFVTSTSGRHLRPGEPVTVLTDQGTFAGFEVVGESVPDDNDVLWVPLTDLERPATVTTPVWFPLDSIEPAH